jgi:diguanylate cyclase (GGDEF)-like protein
VAAGKPDVFADPRVAAPAGARLRDPSRPSIAGTAPDPATIMASVGELPYEWSIDSDELIWGVNAVDVLPVGGAAAIASGRSYAKLLDPASPTSRFDAVMNSPQSDQGAGVCYQVQYALRPAGADKSLWIEDTGRWFAGADGKPARAHGLVRVINERHALEERLVYLSRFDELTGEMNRFHLTEALEATLKQAISQRTSCGFMLAAVDNLARINEAYGFDVADQAIGAVVRRLRAKMRGGDQLGRFSGNKFAVILNNCTPEDMETAAERLIAGVRDDVAHTSAGPVAVTVTIGGVTAPRHAANVQEIIARAQETLDRAKAKRLGAMV